MKLKEIKMLYSNRDKMHSWGHILRLKKRVKLLRKPYKKIDDSLLSFLLNFHGQKEYVLQNKDKFDVSYVESLLRHNKNPQKIEEKLVFDANMLDNVGKAGIKKALYFGTTIGRTKEDTYRYLRMQFKHARFFTILGRKTGKEKIKEMRKVISRKQDKV